MVLNQKMQEIGAIILTGGRSSRMGRDKATLQIAGETLINRILEQLDDLCSEVILAGKFSADSLLSRKVRIVADERPDGGPLAGIVAGLKSSKYDLNLVLACDIPFLDQEFIKSLIKGCNSYDIYVPRYRNGNYEPLLAIYKKNVIPVAEDLLSQGLKKIDLLFSKCHCGFLDVNELPWLVNINTPEEYEAFLKKMNLVQMNDG